MKYAVIQWADGDFSIISQHNDLESAKASFQNQCLIIRRLPNISKAYITIIQDDFVYVDGYVEKIFGKMR